MAARWTLDDVARMRLLSQRLVDPLPTPAEVVRHLTCVQGQDLPGSTTSIALRTTGRSLAEVRAAYDTGQIVRSWPMRGTLFVVAAEDLGWMLSLTAERTLRATVRRREELGITEATLEQAEGVARAVLGAGAPGGPAADEVGGAADDGAGGSAAGTAGATRSTLQAAWAAAGIDPADGRGYHLISHLAGRGVLCQGPTEGKEQRLVLAQEWIPRPRRLGREEAVLEWFTRYARSHGPVPLADFLWWTKLLKRDLAPVLADARGALAAIDVDGVEHFVDPEVLESYPSRRRATAAPLLLPGFDEIVLGYGDRRAVLSPAEEALVVPGRNGVFRPTLVRAGRALGVWTRPTRRGAPVTVAPFGEALPGPVERALPRLTAALPT